VVAVSGSQSYILKDGREMRVGTLGGTDGVCTAMDDLGDVVGVSTTRTELTHAFLWQRGQIIDVSTIKSLDGTTPVLATQSINDVGQIVGAVRNGTDTRAMIFENGHASNLNHLIPWGIIILDLARAINNRGQIIGQGHMNATYVSYLLTPIVPANPPAVHPVSAFDVTPPGYRPQGPPPGTLARPVGAAGA
jgi:probable HAF family extracellular repeat protein